MRNQVFMVFNIHIVIFWFITPCYLEEMTSVLKMEAVEVMTV